jgi:hypothetical protein
MTIGSLALLLGIFGVPVALLWAGHRLRRRSARWHAAFWGGVAGHLAALVIGSVAAVVPAEQWAPTDLWRGALGLWSFLVLPALGAAVGVMRAARRPQP